MPVMLHQPHGAHLTDLDTKAICEVIHVGPSAVYPRCVRLLTPCPVHMCPTTARKLAAEIIRYAEYVERTTDREQTDQTGEENPATNVPGD